jgi:hypothetical protein
MELGHQADRGDRVDAAEAAQPGHRLAAGFLSTELGQLDLELELPLMELLDRQLVTVKGAWLIASSKRNCTSQAQCRVPQSCLVCR